MRGRELLRRLLRVCLIRRGALLAVTRRHRELALLAVLLRRRGLTVSLIWRRRRLLAVLLRRDRLRRLLMSVPLMQLWRVLRVSLIRWGALLAVTRSWRELALLAVLLRGLILRLLGRKLGRQWRRSGAGIHLVLGKRYRLWLTVWREIAVPVRPLAFCELLGGEIW
ncbi:hypothetical protein ACM0CO_19340 [Mycobacteroides abscessus subsp. abscessus]|uniref:hypothetical protein n=1 Tax=Mycobacteroides abscessus TaxID=36809 RepID=UPI0039F0E0D4